MYICHQELIGCYGIYVTTDLFRLSETQSHWLLSIVTSSYETSHWICTCTSNTAGVIKETGIAFPSFPSIWVQQGLCLSLYWPALFLLIVSFYVNFRVLKLCQIVIDLLALGVPFVAFASSRQYFTSWKRQYSSYRVKNYWH